MKELRSIFIEVHFRILEQRGNRFAPMQIEKTLKAAGFDVIEWIDSSHIGAWRTS
jgi:hypothetical protein